MMETFGAYRWKFFLLLLDPNLADEVWGESCMWDAYIEQLVKDLCGDGVGALRTARVRNVLRALLRHWKLDNAQLEALHATMRRMLVAVSTQTHSMSFETLVASELLRRYRRFAGEVAKVLKEEAAEAKKEKEEGERGRLGRPGDSSAPRMHL